MLRSFKFKLRRHALEHMHDTFIRRLLEYSDAVSDNCSKERKNQQDLFHYKTARIILKLCSIQKLFSGL